MGSDASTASNASTSSNAGAYARAPDAISDAGSDAFAKTGERCGLQL